MPRRRNVIPGIARGWVGLTLACTACAGAGRPAKAQDTGGQPRGVIVPKVVCAKDPTVSYAVYLPSNYDRTGKWPIVYAFDPAARGRLAVETFQKAAEKYGYIVVGSNDYRNGPWMPFFPVIRGLWVDTHSRYSLDDGRVYAAGFSGGARAAIMMARGLSGKIAGVMACGAGFPLAEGQGPGKNTDFAFFGIVGFRDFNFTEMRDLDSKLSDLGLTHRLSIFDGPHEWAPPEKIAEAFEWMEIQAMKSGRRQKDSTLIDSIYSAQSADLQHVQGTGDVAWAFHREEQMAEDFRGIRDVSDIESQIRAMQGTRELKSALKQERKREVRIAELEWEFYTAYRRVLAALLAPGAGEYERKRALGELRAPELLRLKTAKPDSDEGIAAERSLTGVMIHSIEDGAESRAKGDFARLLVDAEVASTCAPQNGYVAYQLARAYASNKNPKGAIAALKQSMDKGFSDLDDLNKNPDFAALRGTPEFQEAVEALRKKLALSPTNQ